MNVFQNVESHRHMHPGSCDRNFRKDRGAQVFGSRLRQNQRKRWSKSWVSSEGGNQVMEENLVLFCFSLMSFSWCLCVIAGGFLLSSQGILKLGGESANFGFSWCWYIYILCWSVCQSVTSRLKTSRYRDFSQFFESIGLGLENFGLEKSLGIGLENI